MTKAFSNRVICFINAVILRWEQMHFSQNLSSHGSTFPPPKMIRVDLIFVNKYFSLQVCGKKYSDLRQHVRIVHEGAKVRLIFLGFSKL